MGAFSGLWQRYLNSGSRHFSSVIELKRNRVLNMLFSMCFLAAVYLVVIELIFAFVLLGRDRERYIGYIIPFAAVTLLYPLLVAGTVLLKNYYGTFQVTFLNNIFVNAFCFVLARFLGEKANMHLIILSQFPIIFLFYEFGRWRSIVGHILLVVFGVTATLVSYRVSQPLYPLPPDLEDIPGYLCWLATFAMLVQYSVYNWKQVHVTETKLAEERDHTKGLLEETIPKLRSAEAKYRHLVDDSDDLIFQLDRTGTILSMNLTVQRMLGYAPHEMTDRSLFEFISAGGDADPEFNRNIARKQLEELPRLKGALKLRTAFMHKHRSEAVEVQLVLQKTDGADSEEVLGKASVVEPEVSLRFLRQEKGRYTLSNNIVHAEILSQKIAERIAAYYSPHELNALRTCIREILVNAIEHGNLAVTFDEKTRAIEAGDYMQFLLERQKEKKYAGREVQVHYVVNKRTFILRVTDDGGGFDHRNFIERVHNDASMIMLEHGRGIIMTQNAFDSVEYNKAGNEVTLRKAVPAKI